jgi:folate-binding protein YgfZ
VRGEDALVFLQGQFSQDLRSAEAGQQPAAYGLWLNHKGRVLADSFALVAGPAQVWLVSYFSAAAEIRAHLESHIIADDVTVEDCTASWRGLALGGAGARTWLGERRSVPGKFARVGVGFVFCGRRGAEENWEWLAPVTSPPPPADDAPLEISAAMLEQTRLAAGVPAVPADLGPGDLPHEGGLDTVAVSYTKGCYLGQEVMARLRTGKIRRRLARVAGAGAPPAPLPAPLFQGAKKVGELRSAAADGAGGFLGLAMLTLLGLDPTSQLATAADATPAISLLDAPR